MNWQNLLGLWTVFLLLVGLSLLAAASLTTAGALDITAAPRPEHSLHGAQDSPPRTGATDPFGYTCTNSIEPGGAIFTWLDITDGTPLAPPDDEAIDITIPFTFTLYTLSTRNMSVYNDGVLLLDAMAVPLPEPNEPLSTTTLNDLIAPFWDDLDTDQGDVYSKTLGTAPHRRFVVEWYDRPHYSFSPSSDTATFEVILYEGTNNIKFQYLDTLFGDPLWDQGASATAGICQSGTHYLQYSHDEPVLLSEMAICFQYPGSPACDIPRIGVSPTAIRATQLAGEVTTHTLTISNTGHADLIFQLEEIPSTSGSNPVPDSHQIGTVNAGPEAVVQADVPWVAGYPITGTIPGGDSLPAATACRSLWSLPHPGRSLASTRRRWALPATIPSRPATTCH